jgi:hypothetical protein
MLGLTLKTEGRRGSQRRLGEGGRYLGLLRNGGPAAPRVGSENAEAHNCGLLSVQETGCGTRDGSIAPKSNAHRKSDQKLDAALMRVAALRSVLGNEWSGPSVAGDDQAPRFRGAPRAARRLDATLEALQPCGSASHDRPRLKSRTRAEATSDSHTRIPASDHQTSITLSFGTAKCAASGPARESKSTGMMMILPERKRSAI